MKLHINNKIALKKRVDLSPLKEYGILITNSGKHLQEQKIVLNPGDMSYMLQALTHCTKKQVVAAWWHPIVGMELIEVEK